MFIGTTRVLAEGAFGQERSEEMRFARFDVSIPPQRTRGDINWPTRFEKPNPARHFLTTKEVLYPSNPDFRADLQRNLAANGYAVAIHCNRSEREANALAEAIRARGGRSTVASSGCKWRGSPQTEM